ncbi:hypothetical protein BH09VER1_BH09VER1_32000 [soil metagenome]
MVTRIALVTSDLFVRRLTPALAAFVKERRDFRVIDVHRPWGELRKIIRECGPGAIITEVLPEITEKIVGLGYPTVVADTDVVFPGAVSIDIDDWEVGATAARFFLDAGYRSFGCVYLGTPYGLQRRDGFLGEVGGRRSEVGSGSGGSRAEARGRRGREGELGFTQSSPSPQREKSPEGRTLGRWRGEGWAGDGSVGSIAVPYSDYRHEVPVGRHYMESWRDRDAGLVSWLRSLPKPAGVFAVHDPLGRTVCEVAREAGLLVPDEIAVVGANNDELVCGLSYPPLSSVSIPWDRIGALAGRWAQRAVASHKGKKMKVPKEALLIQPGAVVRRQSTELAAVVDGMLRAALHYMRAQMASGVTVDKVCSDLRVDRRALERKFAAVMQCTPWEALCRMRVESAKRLLVETDLPMALVAEQVGFGSAERFSVTFKGQAGVSPIGFRKRALGRD